MNVSEIFTIKYVIIQSRWYDISHATFTKVVERSEKFTLLKPLLSHWNTLQKWNIFIFASTVNTQTIFMIICTASDVRNLVQWTYLNVKQFVIWRICYKQLNNRRCIVILVDFICILSVYSLNIFTVYTLDICDPSCARLFLSSYLVLS